jgi:hypothetical protein
MTTISKESKETVPDSSSILLTNDLELDRNKEGKKVYEALTTMVHDIDFYSPISLPLDHLLVVGSLP